MDHELRIQKGGLYKKGDSAHFYEP